MNIRYGFAAGISLAATLMFCGLSEAQSAAQPLLQLAPDQSRYEAKGLPLGSFRLFPTLLLRAAHDSNVYRSDVTPIDDYFFTIDPSLFLKSNWGRHMLEFRAGMNQYLYGQLTHENHTDLDASADGRLDMAEGLTATASASYDIAHEARSSPDMPVDAFKPTRYADFHATAEIDHARGPFDLGAGGTFDRYIFDQTLLTGGGALDNKDRNRSEYNIFAKAGYEFSPGYAAFLRATYDERSYELPADINGFDRNSTGIRLDAGLDVQLTRLIEGSLYAGYLNQDYKAPLKTVHGVDYGAGLTWYATPLATFRLTARHMIDETTIANAAATDQQSVKLGVDYAFRHDLVLTADGGYERDRFAGIGRTDETVSADLGAKYLMNEYMYLSLGYAYANRASSISIFHYSDNTVMLGLGLQL
ncbi:MAG: outer membrane beta-barrel protein [Alphaproteobacteria bacterium]|nr:outer membrane beta-barrel protein [Alphaproteobacteria bacterium]